MNEVELKRWLDAATRGLPATVRTVIHAELIGHYEDARAAALADGLLPVEAHRRALAELGSPEETARGFHDTHLARGQYYRAALAALVPSLAIVVMALMTPLPIFIVLNWLTWGCTLYVLRALNTLLAGRFAYFRLAQPLLLIGLGLTSTTILMTVLNLQMTSIGMIGAVVNNPLILYIHNLFPQMPPTLIMLYGVCAAAIALTGVGWLSLTLHLATAEARCATPQRRLLTPLRWVFMLSGFTLIAHAAAVFLNHYNGLLFTAVLSGSIGTFKLVYCCYIFFRAARGEPQTPALYA